MIFSRSHKPVKNSQIFKVTFVKVPSEVLTLQISIYPIAWANEDLKSLIPLPDLWHLEPEKNIRNTKKSKTGQLVFQERHHSPFKKDGKLLKNFEWPNISRCFNFLPKHNRNLCSLSAIVLKIVGNVFGIGNTIEKRLKIVFIRALLQ